MSSFKYSKKLGFTNVYNYTKKCLLTKVFSKNFHS